VSAIGDGASGAMDAARDRAGDERFREPWEARAFAMARLLRERGVFDRREWTAMLAGEIARAQRAGDPDTGETYWRHWLAALERLITEKGIAPAAELARTVDAWAAAAHRTPHGRPIELRREDFGT
jgi:nitrile hydratase accessory protein